uniref:ATP-dependent DNA helicase n=1 Tax=Mycena chlorophos TaxID=658473 RepID=A0ABQ0LFY5_MYCCL|nr:ATP-dependent helicase [Mycena chlorophos]
MDRMRIGFTENRKQRPLLKPEKRSLAFIQRPRAGFRRRRPALVVLREEGPQALREAYEITADAQAHITDSTWPGPRLCINGRTSLFLDSTQLGWISDPTVICRNTSLVMKRPRLEVYVEIPRMRPPPSKRPRLATLPSTPSSSTTLAVRSADDDDDDDDADELPHTINFERRKRKSEHLVEFGGAIESTIHRLCSTAIDPRLVADIRFVLAKHAPTATPFVALSFPNQPERAPDHLWEPPATSFRLDRRVRRAVETRCGPTLRQTFLLDAFHPFQAEAIAHGLEGEDVLVVAPTGSGKSLCFQLLALQDHVHLGKVTVVLSPLRALIKDQQRHLEEKGIDAIALLTNQPPEQLFAAETLPPLVFVTPEKVQKCPAVKELIVSWYEAGLLARLVFDEAHCASTQRFRDDAFAESWRLHVELPNVPIMALTGSATPQIIDDIRYHLSPRIPQLIRISQNRPNVALTVLRKHTNETAAIGDLVGLLQMASFAGKCGIIFRTRRSACEKLARKLRAKGLSVIHYHAGMDEVERDEAQEMWIAFGMGINKTNVRWVIHFDFPKSVVNLDQEAGRAGRDGGPAQCIIYYNFGDLKHLLEIAQRDNQDTTLALQDALAVVRFCEDKSTCRRVLLLQHLGERYLREDCQNTCSTCVNADKRVEENVTQAATDARALLLSLTQEGRDVTVQHFLQIFLGRKTACTSKNGHREKELFGAGGDMSPDVAELVVAELLRRDVFRQVRKGYATSKWKHWYLELGDEAKAELDGFKVCYHRSQRLPQARACSGQK